MKHADYLKTLEHIADYADAIGMDVKLIGRIKSGKATTPVHYFRKIVERTKGLVSYEDLCSEHERKAAQRATAKKAAAYKATAKRLSIAQRLAIHARACKKVRAWLLEGRAINAILAKDWGCQNLNEALQELKDEGYRILTGRTVIDGKQYVSFYLGAKTVKAREGIWGKTS